MPRHLTLAPHLTTVELHDRYRASHDAVTRSHYQILWRLSEGQRCPEVARLTGYSADWIRTLVRRYNTDGPDAVGDGRHANRGQTPLLDAAGLAALQERLATPPPDGGLWTAPKVAAWMSARLGRPVRPERGWEALRRCGYTLQVPRPAATAADPAAREAFKKGGSPKQWRPSSGAIPTQ